MKEQWKKLDSDAKLLVNVEEGRPLPLKIELPISAFVSSREGCCKKLLTVLRVFVLLAALILLSWAVTILLAQYYYAQSSPLELEKNVFIYDDGDNYDGSSSSGNSIEKSYIANKIVQTMREDEEERSMMKNLAYAESIRDSVSAKLERVGKSESLLVEEPTFVVVNRPSIEVENNEDENEETERRLSESVNKLREMTTEWLELFRKIEEVRQMTEATTGEEAAKNDENIDAVPMIVVNDEEEREDPKIAEVEEQTNEEATPENQDEVVKVLFQLINAIAFDEDTSVEEVGFKQPDSEAKEMTKGIDEETRTESNYDVVPETEVNNDEKVVEEVIEGTTDSPSMAQETVGPLEIATLLSKYLQSVVGQGDELLAWYSRHLDDSDFETENDPLRVYTAKLLYSTNIEEFMADMSVVMKMLLTNPEFAREWTTMLEGNSERDDMSDVNEEDKTVRYRIIDRIETKYNMNKLIKEDPEVLEVFSRMIETSNRLELSQLSVNPQKLYFGEVSVNGNGGLYIESPEETERRLSVLEAIKRVAKDETSEDDESEKVRNIVDAIRKVAIDDETRDEGKVEFTDDDATTTGMTVEPIMNEYGRTSYAEDASEPEEQKNISVMEAVPAIDENFETLIKAVEQVDKEEEEEGGYESELQQIYDSYDDY